MPAAQQQLAPDQDRLPLGQAIEQQQRALSEKQLSEKHTGGRRRQHRSHKSSGGRQHDGDGEDRQERTKKPRLSEQERYYRKFG